MNSTEPIGPSVALAQRQQFADRGYCIVDNLFSGDEIAAIERFFEQFKISGPAIYGSSASYGGGESKFEEVDPSKEQLRAMHPHRHSAQVRTWALNSRVLGAMAELMGHAPLLAQTMYYFKPPGAKGQGMHQDNFYLLAAPATCAAAWTAIDDATLENGCMYVAPGSHRKAIICPANSEDQSWMGYQDGHIKPFPRDVRPIPVEVPRGSTLFFDGNLIHGSGPNRTSHRSRRTFIAHYISETSEQVARFYHPVLDAKGEIVSRLHVPEGGGPCGDGWEGAAH